MSNVIRNTRSVCPVCLENLEAQLVQAENREIYLNRRCEKHGEFSTVVWRGLVDFELWTQNGKQLSCGEGVNCMQNCGICADHESGSCCVLLEVTSRCNLNCRFCFADGGCASDDILIGDIKAAIDDIVKKCGNPLLQLSGGEPTLRDDLPEIIRYAKAAGCSYVQINTNGIRLANDRKYTKALSDAGLDIVFLQFDGTDDKIYENLRGKPLYETKLKAIEVCSEFKLGVTLVPTVVPGVNTADLGNIVRLAAQLSQKVRGIHFQPVSYFGRYPKLPDNGVRYTLDRLMADLSDQTEIQIENFVPSRCDHPLCGFHSNFMVEPDGKLRSLSSVTRLQKGKGSAKDNREYVARHWMRYPGEEKPKGNFAEEMDFETFLYRIRHNSITISSMAFQDAGNLNIERLRRCSLHVYNNGKIMPFCANYLTQIEKES